MADETELDVNAQLDAATEAVQDAQKDDAAVAEQEGDPAEAAEPTEDPAPPTDWRAGIEDKQLRDFAGRFTTAADMAKMAFETRQKLSNAVFLPGKDATEEDIAKFRKQIGVPDEYEWKPAEGQKFSDDDIELQKSVSEQLREANFTAGQQQLVNKLWNDAQADAMVRATKHAEQTYAEADAALRKDWGNDYSANAEFANREFEAVAARAGIKNIGAFVSQRLENGTELRAVPELMKIFAIYGREHGESPGVVGMSSDERSDLETRRRELVAESIEANQRGERDKARRLRDEAMALAVKIHGEAPADGRHEAA